MTWYMVWSAGHGILEGNAGYMVWPGTHGMVYGIAWHGMGWYMGRPSGMTCIWYGLAGMAWYIVWSSGHGMVYGVVWRA